MRHSVQRPEDRHILHVDMDSFFVSVELRERKDARAAPSVVAHDGPRSVVTSASYEARRFGVRSAMPLAQARRLCPHVIVLEPHMEKYRAASKQVMQILRDVTPLVEPLSIDEAFLDVTGSQKLFGTPRQIAAGIRSRMRAELELPASVGIASTKFVAKLASGGAKPDGVLEVPHDQTLAYLHPLPVGALWGVGRRTQQALESRAIRTVGDLAETEYGTLERLLGAASATKLTALANGIDPREVEPEREEKSIGHERTFAADVTDRDEIETQLLRLAEKTGDRLRRHGLSARTVAIKVRWGGFETMTRSRTLSEATHSTQRLYREAVGLFRAADTGQPVRLIGVRAENLSEGDSGSLLWNDDEQWDRVDAAIDSVRNRFGDIGVHAARLLPRAGRGERREGEREA